MDNKPSIREDNSEIVTLYQTLQSHRQHAERIFWSRVQTLHAIQAGVLAGGFYLVSQRWSVLATITFSLGAILTFFLGRLAHNDWSDAAVNQETMNKLGDELKIRRTSERRGLKKLLKSHSILFWMIRVFWAGDIALAIIICKGVNLLQ